MMLRVAWRSLITRPIRAAVLAAGFGFGIAVMVELLGVGAVILEQSHAPALAGGGDVVVSGQFGVVSSARYVLASLARAAGVADQVATASPTRRERLFLITPGKTIPISVTGGVPSLERSIGDPDVSGSAAWVDAPGDERWIRPDRGDVLRALDRFHPIPTARVSSASWAEWLYFNGRTADGRLRLYVTFIVGPPAATPGMRHASVRLQLQHDGRATTYSTTAEVNEETVLANAPNLDIAGSRVRLEAATYRITLALPGRSVDASRFDPIEVSRSAEASRSNEIGRSHSDAGASVEGEILLEAAAQSLPPATIHGAGGWLSGYVVPALSGTMKGTLHLGGDVIDVTGATGYHDHNWGFWEGVRWQWGQVVHDDVSIVYGRVFPPSDVADSSRIPGFLAVLGPEGPLGFSSTVTIDDSTPGRIDVRAVRGVNLHLNLAVDETVRTELAMTKAAAGPPMNFLQLSGVYRVEGRAGGRTLDFTARGSGETFKPQ